MRGLGGSRRRAGTRPGVARQARGDRVHARRPCGEARGPRDVGDRAARPAGSLGGPYLGTLDAEPETNWPGAVEQLSPPRRTRRAITRRSPMRCGDTLELQARLFGKSGAAGPGVCRPNSEVAGLGLVWASSRGGAKCTRAGGRQSWPRRIIRSVEARAGLALGTASPGRYRPLGSEYALPVRRGCKRVEPQKAPAEREPHAATALR